MRPMTKLQGILPTNVTSLKSDLSRDQYVISCNRGLNIALTGKDVPRPLTPDLWVFLFQTIDAEWVKWASPTGTYVYVKAFVVNVNKRLKPFF